MEVLISQTETTFSFLILTLSDVYQKSLSPESQNFVQMADLLLKIPCQFGETGNGNLQFLRDRGI